MIHSLSGGVIADNTAALFAKVEISGAFYWYIAPFPISAGEKALAPFGGEARGGDGRKNGTLHPADGSRSFPPRQNAGKDIKNVDSVPPVWYNHIVIGE